MKDLPKITDTNWEMLCESIEQKTELVTYALFKRLRTNGSQNEDLGVGFNEHTKKLYCYAAGLVGTEEGFVRVTAGQFKAMCDAYAA